MKDKWYKVIKKVKKNQFLFEELVKRDFKEKYKSTVIGMGWSVLSPLLNLFVMKLIFTQFFGRNTPHYTTYLFAGNVLFSYFRESTRGGMNALLANRKIFTKINVPKYLFLLSKNVSAFINLGLTMMVFFLFAALDGIYFGWHFIALVYPIVCLVMLAVGMGLILSAMFVFFRDTRYLYDVFLMLLNYASAIFYRLDGYPMEIQRIFLLNPVYCAIKYVRMVTIDGVIPGVELHVLLMAYGLAAMLIGGLIYKKKNHEFLYYV